MPVLTKPSPSGKPTSTSPPQPSVVLEDTGFTQLWSTFRDQATQVANNPTDTHEYQQKVAGLLETLQRLIFGLDQGKKLVAVKNGALELIVKLSDTFQFSDPITLAALKATKSCVVKNPAGRTCCRSAGTLKWMNTRLTSLLSNQDPSKATLVEEGLTTLAAICLGDDLNALQVSRIQQNIEYSLSLPLSSKMYPAFQGAKEFRVILDKVSLIYPKECHPSLHQKVTYLDALFNVMEREQDKLLNSKAIDTFFETVQENELILTKETWEDTEAEIVYSEALAKLEPLACETKLLDTLMCNLYERRSTAKFSLQKWEGCLADVDFCLDKFEVSPEMTIQLLVSRTNVLQAMGLLQDAKEGIGKALLMHPQSKELQEKLEELNNM